MKGRIQAMEPKFRQATLELAERVFTDSEGAESGKLVRELVAEIRGMDTYLPELEMIMVDADEQVIGLAMFSRFRLEGRHETELLLLSPVAVKTECQRQHISRDLIEEGFRRATDMGFRAVLVEGNPRNYRSRGFVTSVPFGIVADASVGLPAPECLMVRELVPGGLEGIRGIVDYHAYRCLR